MHELFFKLKAANKLGCEAQRFTAYPHSYLRLCECEPIIQKMLSGAVLIHRGGQMTSGSKQFPFLPTPWIQRAFYKKMSSIQWTQEFHVITKESYHGKSMYLWL